MNGEVSTMSSRVENGKVINEVKNLGQLIGNLRGKTVNGKESINSGDFASYVDILNKDGKLNLERLITDLGVKTVESLAREW